MADQQANNLPEAAEWAAKNTKGERVIELEQRAEAAELERDTAVRQNDLLHKQLVAAEARAETARAEALEEAATICDGEVVEGYYVRWPCWNPNGNLHADDQVCALTRALAHTIRALLTAPPPTAKEG